MEAADTVAELQEWIRSTLEELDSPDAAFHISWKWSQRWDDVVASAYHLGRPEIVYGLNEPLPSASFPPDSPAGKAIRDLVRERLVEVRRRLNSTDTSYSALVDEDYRPPLDWHVTPEGKAVLADGFAQKLNCIANELEAGNFKGLREHELREQAGTVIINAHSKRFLRSIPNLGKFVAWHTASSENDPPVGEGGLQARRCRCPSNLFLDVIGGQKIIVRLEADGTFTEIGPKSDDGILPAIDPTVFKRGDAAGACRFLASTITREAAMEAERTVHKQVNGVAERAREIAGRLENLSSEIISSFKITDVTQRVAHVNQITLAISVDAAPVIMWIERNRPDAALLEKRRLANMETQASEAAAADAPEYSEGEVAENDGSNPISQGARINATLAVFCKLFAVAMQSWAVDIESSETGGGKLQAPPVSEHRCAPMTKAEMARRITGKRTARFREVECFLANFDLKNVSGKKWTVRLDGMDANNRRKLESP